MKVLHIATGLENGGAEAVLYRLISGSKTRAGDSVVSLSGVGFYGKRLMDRGVRVHALQMPRGRLSVAAPIEILRVIKSVQPDVIQTWMYHADLVGGVMARLAREGVVVWGIHNSDLSPAKTKRTTRMVARMCGKIAGVVPSKIICCSEQAAQAHAQLGYPVRKLVVVHNGIDVDEFRPLSQSRARIRQEWRIGSDEVLLGMVARWDSHKDHETFVRAAVHLKSRARRPWCCVLVGPGMVVTNRELVGLLDKHGMRSHFRLVGERADIPAVMNALDLHVLSSSGEAFGNVTIEAMSCGVPAVVTAVGAGSAIVGETGWVVAPSKPDALGEALIAACEAMTNDDTWRRRKVDCRSRVVERFSIERMIRGYHEVWESALAEVS